MAWLFIGMAWQGFSFFIFFLVLFLCLFSLSVATDCALSHADMGAPGRAISLHERECELYLTFAVLVNKKSPPSPGGPDVTVGCGGESRGNGAFYVAGRHL